MILISIEKCQGIAEELNPRVNKGEDYTSHNPAS